MGTGKERLRRWRERNKAEGKQSFTIMLSREAKDALFEEKKMSGASYSVIVEQALLNCKKQTAAPAVGDQIPKRTKILIDEDGVIRGNIEQEETPRKKIVIEDDTATQLSQGFIPRLLKRSNNRFYKFKK